MLAFRHFSALIAGALLAGCAAAGNPELACQKRLATARNEPAAAGDDFNHQAYAKVDRTGCTPTQLAVLDQVLTLTKDLPGLTQANNDLGAGGDDTAHMAAFQRMNDAVIALNDLERAIQSDLAQMEPPQ